jgi:hypothetical protein
MEKKDENTGDAFFVDSKGKNVPDPRGKAVTVSTNCGYD